MTVKEIYNKLLKARRASDFFGKISSLDDLKKKYRDYSKQVHPDAVKSDKYIANEAFNMLNKLYDDGQKEFENGIYGIVDPIKIYSQKSPLFDLKIKGNNYYFYENIFEGEVANIYKGVCNGSLIYMKLAIDSDDNNLIETEYKVLSEYRHQLLPYVEERIKINGCSAIIMREVRGLSMDEFMKQYPKGVPPEHVMWMLERMLNVVGYLHSNKVVHGNIKPENVMIHKETHTVSLIGLAFCIPEANKDSAHYQIVNDVYTAPEVNKTSIVSPVSDIYSIGKITIQLLGGNITTNGMPVKIDSRVREFVRNMVKKDNRPDDAWKLWSELIKLRNEVYGTKRFQTLE